MRGEMKRIMRWLFRYIHPARASILHAELHSISDSLWSLAEADSDNNVLGMETRLRLNRMQRELQDLVAGRLGFNATETWRTAYEEVLTRCEAKRYLSAAIVRNEDYWQDIPGKKSIEFNLLLLEHGFYIHRILVIDDFLWPTAAKTPGKPLMTWILEQYAAGMDISTPTCNHAHYATNFPLMKPIFAWLKTGGSVCPYSRRSSRRFKSWK